MDGDLELRQQKTQKHRWVSRRTTRRAFVAVALLGIACAAGLQMPAENEWARITEAGILRLPVEGLPGQYTLIYRFALTPKRGDLARVDVLDVSGSDPVMLLRGGPIGAENAWSTEKVPLSAQSVPWLFTSGPTRKLFRFVLYAESGDTSTLEQLVLFSADTKAYYRRRLAP